MSERGPGLLVGAGLAACAVCCAGPVAGVLAAIGIGSIAGFALLGAVGLLAMLLVGVAMLLRRRRRQQGACTASDADQPVSLGQSRSGS